MRDAHIRACWPELHRALIDIVTVMNQPERDATLLAMAGLSLDRALFPPLMLIAKRGPIGVVDLAGHTGRDHTTVSRQVARLEKLGLISRRAGLGDRRTREATITPEGRLAIDKLDVARERVALALFREWGRSDLDQLLRLLRLLADGLDETYAPVGKT